MRRKRLFLTLAAAGLGLGLLLGPALRGPAEGAGMSVNGMVVTSHPLAAQAGLRMLQAGGNAFDAAVASAAVLAVVEPLMSGLGGVGGYALIYDAEKAEVRSVDFIGAAPAAADPEAFTAGSRLWDRTHPARDSFMAPLVPGNLAGWAALLEEYGSMSWAEVLAPAIEYAEGRFRGDPGGERTVRDQRVRRRRGPLSLWREHLLQGREALAGGRGAEAARPGEDLPGHRGERTRGPLRRGDCGNRGGLLPEQRRHPHRGGLCELPGALEQSALDHLPRLHGVQPASGRFGTDRAADAQNPRAVRRGGARTQLRGVHPPGRRGDEARLRGRGHLQHREGLRRHPARPAALEGVRGAAGGTDRSVAGAVPRGRTPRERRAHRSGAHHPPPPWWTRTTTW